MRVALFFLYAFGFMIGLPALVLYFVQRSIGPLQYPPPPAVTWDPAWFETDGAFNEPQRLLATQGPVIDLLRELKQPIIQIIRDAGWEYRPVITFFRPIGG